MKKKANLSQYIKQLILEYDTKLPDYVLYNGMKWKNTWNKYFGAGYVQLTANLSAHPKSIFISQSSMLKYLNADKAEVIDKLTKSQIVDTTPYKTWITNNTMKTQTESKLKNYIKKVISESRKKKLTEASISDNLHNELIKLLDKINKKEGIDPESAKKYNDGQLLAMFLNGVFQSALTSKLDNKARASFRKEFKF